MELLRFALEEFQICFLGWFVFLSRLVFEFFQKCFGRPRGRLRTARQQTGGLPGSYLLRPPGSYLLRPPWLIFAEAFFGRVMTSRKVRLGARLGVSWRGRGTVGSMVLLRRIHRQQTVQAFFADLSQLNGKSWKKVTYGNNAMTIYLSHLNI